MGKHTVEQSLRIDAHFWGREPVRRTAPALARALADALPRLRAGEKPEHAGLMNMEWTRGWQKTPAGSIRWGVKATDGDQITRLLLLFSTYYAGQSYGRRQEVRLDWHTRDGKASSRPVLICPFCGRRCRYLCSAYPGRQGGPYAGEFACRGCAQLCYAQQLEYQGVWIKNWKSVERLSTKAILHPDRLTEADMVKMQVASQSFESAGNTRLDTLLARLDPAAQSQAEDAEERRVWDVLPPNVFTPPKLRGRPSPKKERQQARACVKLLRDAQKEAQKQAQPKRPPGRPKTRRAYSGTFRAESSYAGNLSPEEGYCVSCRAGRLIADAVSFTASNGRSGIKGRCETCGRGLCRAIVTFMPGLFGAGTLADTLQEVRCSFFW